MSTAEKPRTVRPGLLVALKSSIEGGVDYESRNIEEPHDEEGELVSKWETTKTVTDPVEFNVAKEVRSKARGQVVNVCAATAFGLLCPLDREPQLLEGVAEMHRIADKFNAGSRISKVVMRVIIGRVEQDDVEAIRAIETEVASLLAGIEGGVERMDSDAIGKSCDKARDLSAMLEDDSKLVIKEAIDAARVVKRRINKLVKAGEVAKLTVDQEVLAKVKAARTSFLDIDSDEVEVQAPEVDAAPAIDIDEPEEVDYLMQNQPGDGGVDYSEYADVLSEGLDKLADDVPIEALQNLQKPPEIEL